MKIKDGFVLKQIADSFLVVPLGTQVSQFGAIIKLNDSSAFLWSKMSSDVTEKQLVDALMNEYDVTEETAVSGVSAFLKNLKDNDLIE